MISQQGRAEAHKGQHPDQGVLEHIGLAGRDPFLCRITPRRPGLQAMESLGY